MRCPHCAARDVAPPVCHVCGADPASAAVEHPAPIELERERHDPALPVVEERLPDLVTTEEALGDVRIPEEPARAGGAGVCPRCGAAAGSDRFCAACGCVLRPPTSGERARGAAASRALRCLECGAPNDARRGLCVSCGARL